MLKTSGTTAECRVDFGDSGDSSRGAIGYNHSDDALKFYTTGVANERMRIDSSGNVGIGSSPVGSFRLKIDGGDSAEGLFIHAGSSSSQWLIRAEDNAANQRFVVKADGEVIIGDGNLVIGTAGKGIDFSANSHAGGMTSELLDTYEEGTYTPAILDGGSNTQTFNATGRYTRIGRNVQCQFLLQFSGVGNDNQVKFNMPFTGLNNGALGGGVCIWSNLPNFTGMDSIVLAVQANTATIACHYGIDSAATLGTASYSNKAFYGVFQYEAA